MGTLGPLITAKEENYQPALLASFQFTDGSMLYASTHNLSAAEGGNTFQGNSYLARIMQEDIAAVQARSEQGIDRISDVTIRLANDDQYILLNYELNSTRGFKGAILQLALVNMDIDPTSGQWFFTSDSPAPFKFTGICDAPGQAPNGAQYLSIRATTAHNLAMVELPNLHIQQRCINVFPVNAARRLAGATDMSSWEWYCGYDPDQAGTDPEIGGDARRGNTTTPNATDAYGNVVADGSGIYISCGYTKADCVARGMYGQDSSSRKTCRFTAIQWAPSWRETQSKSYVQGKNVTVWAQQNQSIFTRSYPMAYGSQWINNPVIANIIGDGNSTRMEVVLCAGDIGPGGIQLVVVNGVVVPGNAPGIDPLERWNFLDGHSIDSVATGSRNGWINQDAEYNGLGDPYGSLATIEIVVYADLAQSNSIPQVQVLINGPRVTKYAPIATYNSGVITLPSGIANVDIAGNSPFTIQIVGNSLSVANGTWGLTSWSYGPPGTITLTSGPAGTGTGGYIRYLAYGTVEGITPPTGGAAYGSSGINPAWAIFDMLIQANYSFAELDVNSFVAAAQFCDQPISYIDLNGNTQAHAQYIFQAALVDRAKANTTIQAALRSFNAQLVPNSDTGLLQLFVRGTLADWQPSPIPGSNYNTAVASVTFANAPANGYVAYLIDDSVVLRDDSGELQVNGPYALPTAQCPNSITIAFQDADNQWVQDSAQITDPADVNRSAGYQLGGAQVPANFSVLGISSFDQAGRIGNTILAENFRGNPFSQTDTRASYFWQVTTTHRLEHLRVGHIVLFRLAAPSISPSTPLQSPSGTNITGVLCRVEAIAPAQDYQRMQVTLKWHEDAWYTTLYGQKGPTPGYSNPLKQLPSRPPLPWRPYGQQPITGDAEWAATEWGFGVAQQYGQQADGSPLAQVVIVGCLPVNQFSQSVQPPQVGVQGATAASGGTVPGGVRIYMAIAAQDSNGQWSALSGFSVVVTAGGGNLNTVTTPTINWQSGTSGWVLFGGYSQHLLCEQSAGSGTPPGTITISNLNVATYGAPDALAKQMLFEVKRVIHGGVFGDTCTACASNGDGTGTITFATLTTNHQFQQVDATHGYDLALLANPIADTTPVPIANFHVIDNTGGVYHVSPDPIAVGLATSGGYVFEMRAFPSIISSTTIGDTNFANAYASGGLTASAEIGNRVRIVRGAGAGQERKITANTSTTLTIDRAWDTTPDTTSRFIVEEAAWQDQPAVDISSSAISTSQTVATLNIDNYREQTILIRAVVLDQSGNMASRRFSPLREMYVWGGQGTRVVTASGSQILTDRVLLFDTSNVTQPTPDTLSAAITTTTATTISLTSGAASVNGTYIQIDSEVMYVQSGGGTSSLTVLRGQLGTTAATHLNGATVTLPGALTFHLLSILQVPNQGLLLHKTSTELNYVDILPASGETLPDGAPSQILADTSSLLGTFQITAPGA